MTDERDSSPLSTLSELDAASPPVPATSSNATTSAIGPSATGTSATKSATTSATTSSSSSTTRLTRSQSHSPSQPSRTPPPSVPAASNEPNRRSSLRSSISTPISTPILTPIPATSQPSTAVPRVPKVPSRHGTASIRRSERERRDKQRGEDVCLVCTPPGTALTAEQEKANQDKVWIQCEHCNAWYHWHCINLNTGDSPDDFDKWYCPTCIKVTVATRHPLACTRRPVPRRTNRAAPKIDYANLDAHLPADHLRWQRVVATRKVLPANFPKLRPERLTEEWLFKEGTWSEPIIVESPRGLGMQMPDPSTSISAIADEIGGDHPIEALDVAAQDRDRTIKTLRQWADYFENPRRDKVRNVISLEVGSTPFGEKIVAPEMVRRLDWVDNIWPKDCRDEGQYPQVQKYCLMSVAESWTDWHIDFAGSSVFYHILRGGKVFYFIRPTKENLKAYETWSGNTDRQEANWLGDHVDAVYRVELVPGNTMFIPSGWIHAVETPSDSLVIGGNFVHSLNIETQLEVYRIELATKVPKKFRFPHFVTLLWHVANHYTARLNKALASSASMRTWPAELRSRRVLLGLKQASEFLIEQTTRWAKGTNELSRERRRVAIHNVPNTYIKNANELSREFRQVVLRALGEPMDRLCELSNDAMSLTWVSPEELRAEAMARDMMSTPKGKAVNGRGATEGLAPMMNGHGDAGIKRKASDAVSFQETAVMMDPHASGTRSKKPRITPSGMTAVPNDAPTILENTTPYERRPMRTQQMMDPKRAEVGLQLATVNESSNTKTIVKRWEEGGRVFIDVRKMVTTIERVEFGVPEEEIVAAQQTLGQRGAEGVGGVQGEQEIQADGTADSAGSSTAGRQDVRQTTVQDLPMEVDQTPVPTVPVASTSTSALVPAPAPTPAPAPKPAQIRPPIVLAEAPAHPFPTWDPYHPTAYKLSTDPYVRFEQMSRIINTYNDPHLIKATGLNSALMGSDGTSDADDWTDEKFFDVVWSMRPVPKKGRASEWNLRRQAHGSQSKPRISSGKMGVALKDDTQSQGSTSVPTSASTAASTSASASASTAASTSASASASSSTSQAPVLETGPAATSPSLQRPDSGDVPIASPHLKSMQPITSSPVPTMSYIQRNQPQLDSVAPRSTVLPVAQS